MIAAVIATGGPQLADGWARCDFIGLSKTTIDAGREMDQEREDVARGLITRRDHYGNRSRSWRRETDHVFEEIDYILDRAKEVAEEHDIPVETGGVTGVPPGQSQTCAMSTSSMTHGRNTPIKRSSS